MVTVIVFYNNNKQSFTLNNVTDIVCDFANNEFVLETELSRFCYNWKEIDHFEVRNN